MDRRNFGETEIILQVCPSSLKLLVSKPDSLEALYKLFLPRIVATHAKSEHWTRAESAHWQRLLYCTVKRTVYFQDSYTRERPSSDQHELTFYSTHSIKQSMYVNQTLSRQRLQEQVVVSLRGTDQAVTTIYASTQCL